MKTSGRELSIFNTSKIKSRNTACETSISTDLAIIVKSTYNFKLYADLTYTFVKFKLSFELDTNATHTHTQWENVTLYYNQISTHPLFPFINVHSSFLDWDKLI